jgi:ABC-type transporter Mla MlaB component
MRTHRSTTSAMSLALEDGLDVEGLERRTAIRVVNIGAPTASADLPALCDRLRSVLTDGDAEVVICDVGRLALADAAAIEGLARLQLTARRLGREIRLRNASDELHGLLALVGLCGVVGACPELRLEGEGQAEQREHPRRVEEEGDSADAVAGDFEHLE